MEKWQNKTTKELVEALLALETIDEAKRFLRDLLTPQEIIEFGKRWKVARMLAQKKPYSQVVRETGLSSTTVARVAKWLRKGMGGYKLMVQRLREVHHVNLSSAKGLS